MKTLSLKVILIGSVSGLFVSATAQQSNDCKTLIFHQDSVLNRIGTFETQFTFNGLPSERGTCALGQQCMGADSVLQPRQKEQATQLLTK